VASVATELAEVKTKNDALKDSQKGKKDEENPSAEKDELSALV
jgi:molecular chaperone HtpG